MLVSMNTDIQQLNGTNPTVTLVQSQDVNDPATLRWFETRRRVLLIELGLVEDILIEHGQLKERTKPRKERP